MDKNQAQKMTDEVLFADLIIRIKSIETLLISKGIFTEAELNEQIKSALDVLTLSILQKSNVPGDLNKIVETLGRK